MQFPWRRQALQPPMTDDEFETWIETHVLRGWRIVVRTKNTATMVRDLLPDRTLAALELFSGNYDQAQRTMYRYPRQERKTLTRYDKRNIWLTPQERQLLDRGADA